MRDAKPPTRYTVFSILDTLMAKHREGTRVVHNICRRTDVLSALLNLGDEFLEGYMKLMSNEMDPRNLVLVFSITRIICIEFDISRHVEVGLFICPNDAWLIILPLLKEIFELTFRFFPISVNLVDYPYALSESDLRAALLCVPYIFSKTKVLTVCSIGLV